MSEDHAKPNLPRSELVKINFKLSAEDRAKGVEAENLWAENLGNGQYRIDSIPFYVYGITYGDIIDAGSEDGRLVFRAVVKRSGHSNYRVLVNDQRGFESEGFKTLWRQLERLGCSSEVAKKRWIAVDVPPSSDILAAYRILEAGEESGVWSFDEGYCGHAV